MKPEIIHKIVQEQEITIPAWILYTLVQYTEVSVKRGGISAGELSSVGTAYESGTKVLSELLKKHAVETETPKTETPEPQPKTPNPPTDKKHQSHKSHHKEIKPSLSSIKECVPETPKPLEPVIVSVIKKRNNNNNNNNNNSTTTKKKTKKK